MVHSNRPIRLLYLPLIYISYPPCGKWMSELSNWKLVFPITYNYGTNWLHHFVWSLPDLQAFSPWLYNSSHWPLPRNVTYTYYFSGVGRLSFYKFGMLYENGNVISLCWKFWPCLRTRPLLSSLLCLFLLVHTAWHQNNVSCCLIPRHRLYNAVV